MSSLTTHDNKKYNIKVIDDGSASKVLKKYKKMR